MEEAASPWQQPPVSAQTNNLLHKNVVRSDCENIGGAIRAVPLQHVSQGGSHTLSWPRFTGLNIENNYSNDGNEDLMTFPRSAAGESQFR